MSSLADDIEGARKAGQSDETILKALQAYDPSTSEDIQGALKAGRKPAEVLSGLAAYEQQFPKAPAAEGFLDRAFGNPLRYGAADTLRGDAETAKVLGAPDVGDTLQGTAAKIEPQGYQPAGPEAKKAWDQSHYLDWASLIPRRALESLPQLGQAGIGAAAGSFLGPIGTRLGWMAGHGASTLGRNAEDSARARSGSDTADVGPEDLTRGALSSAAEAYLAGKGTSAATGGILKAGASSLPAATLAVGKGALSDAAANVASTAAHKGILDPNGDASLGDLAEAGATGGLTGAALRSARLPTDYAVLNRNKDISPEAGGRVADRLYATGEPLGTSAGDKAAYDKASDDLKVQRNSNKPQGQDNATNEVMSRVSTDLDKGRTPAEADVNVLKSAFGPDDKFVNAIEDHSILNEVRDQGKDVNGGIAGGLQATKVGQLVNPANKFARMAEGGNLLSAATGVHIGLPELGLATGLNPIAVAAAHAGLWGGMKGVDALTGKNRPVSQFAERYRTDTPFDPSQLSSFNDQNAIANDKLKSLGKTAAIMRNSDPSNTAVGDATMPLRVARLKQQFAAQAERDSEAAIKQQVSEERAQKREETLAGLKSLLEGDNAEAKFQARVAELGAKRKSKQQAEQPQPDVMPPHPTMRVEEGGHAVDRTTAGVLKAARYAESIRGRMAAKNDAINASIAENPAHATALTSLLTELHTSNARSRNGAEAVIQRHLQNLPPDVQASVRKHLTEKFWNAWRKVND